MLIEFSVGNYRSFKDTVTFSMVTADIAVENQELNQNNTIPIDEELTLLKSAAIYGANSSGKSNFIKALAFMKWFMINSSKETQSTDEIEVENFALSTETENKPSFFELVFLIENVKYKYGFKATKEKIISEWLYYVPKKKEFKLFTRTQEKISSNKRYSEIELEKITRTNALFLSVSAQFNVKIAEKILQWLTHNLNIVSGLNDANLFNYTLQSLSINKLEIIKLFKKLDLAITDLKIEETNITFDSLPEKIPLELKKLILKNSQGKATSIQTLHKKYNEKGEFVSETLFDLQEQESEGTQKVFAISGALIDTLNQGKILIFDEFDARLHPLISRAILQLFNSLENNLKNAQLIFTTHDTNLLDSKLFRRDQIWFTEKNRYGSTDLYSLVEYKIANDASFESDYIKGKYGAIPYIGNLIF